MNSGNVSAVRQDIGLRVRIRSTLYRLQVTAGGGPPAAYLVQQYRIGSKMTSAVVSGATGLVGSNVLSTLANHPAIAVVHAFSRRELPTASPKVKALIASDSSTWPSQYPQKAPLFISALGTTRGQAGSLENQRKIDYDLNLDLAKSAKQAGATTYVLVSSGGANPKSFLAFPRMKGELEEAVKALDFDHTVILRPGLIVGQREDSRPPEYAFRKIASIAGSVSSTWLKDFWAQDADVIANGNSYQCPCLQDKANVG